MFTPAVPMGGLTGWHFLRATMDRQQAQMDKSPEMVRDVTRAKEILAQAQSFDDILDNRSALKVVLGAFDLSSDINNRAFIKKMMESDLSDLKSLANRMSDNRYKDLAQAVSDLAERGRFGHETIDDIVQDYKETSFAVAIGEQDNNLRMALNAKSELPELVASGKSERALWYSVLGNPPLRKVFETFLRLPSSFAKIDLEKQVDVMQEKLAARTGSASLKQFSDAQATENLVKKFLLQTELNTSASMTGSASALLILQQAAGAVV